MLDDQQQDMMLNVDDMISRFNNEQQGMMLNIDDMMSCNVTDIIRERTQLENKYNNIIGYVNSWLAMKMSWLPYKSICPLTLFKKYYDQMMIDNYEKEKQAFLRKVNFFIYMTGNKIDVEKLSSINVKDKLEEFNKALYQYDKQLNENYLLFLNLPETHKVLFNAFKLGMMLPAHVQAHDKSITIRDAIKLFLHNPQNSERGKISCLISYLSKNNLGPYALSENTDIKVKMPDDICNGMILGMIKLYKNTIEQFNKDGTNDQYKYNSINLFNTWVLGLHDKLREVLFCIYVFNNEHDLSPIHDACKCTKWKEIDNKRKSESDNQLYIKNS